MYINQINPKTFNAAPAVPVRKLTPLSEYKGPLLELDKSDIEKINEIKSRITKLETEYLSLDNYIRYAKHVKSGLYEKLLMIKLCMDAAHDEIREIKMARMKAQRQSS